VILMVVMTVWRLSAGALSSELRAIGVNCNQ
jgi:hypothetical protein